MMLCAANPFVQRGSFYLMWRMPRPVRSSTVVIWSTGCPASRLRRVSTKRRRAWGHGRGGGVEAGGLIWTTVLGEDLHHLILLKPSNNHKNNIQHLHKNVYS